MAEYSKEEIRRIEQKWQDKWEKEGIYRVETDPSKPKYYVLDMFPYPSGAGLHVGHPLGYIATDIVSRYKRLKGFNVLHPMGFDAFGLPAEQYAIQTGQHPAVTTAKNIETYKRQLRKIGFSYDWSREVQTCDPAYYKWTQWIFMQLFNAWYNKKSGKFGQTEPITTLITELEKNGNKNIDAACAEDTPFISADQWKHFNEKEKENFLQHYRIAYQSETMVNWCAALGTVLSNDEVKDGVSERGGYPVERIKMLQWSMRISAYAERLLAGLDTIDWPEPLKEMQRNWIGKSKGAQLEFNIQNSAFKIEVFTTRIDTIFGATFLVLAPEHELVGKITTEAQRNEVNAYVDVAKNRSERERMSEVKRVSGAFTGAYAINPFNNERIPIWISDYVLAGYGTGAVMAVPGHDERDHRFAKHFNLPIVQVVEGPGVEEEAFVSWDAKIINSGFMNGLTVDEAIEAGIKFVEEKGIGKGKVNYRMRDAIFGRQRYWGEPFPVYFNDGIPKLVDEKDLPITLPEIDEYKPTETGEPPLARAKNWNYKPRPNPSPGERGYETSEKKYWHLLKEFSKENRKNQTEAETIIWNQVRDSKLGHKIRRQHAIGIFIADFVCLDKRLVIEIDGDYHNKTKEYDQARTEFLNSEGFSVIRFSNSEVINNLQDVISSIKTSLYSAPSIARTSPSPAEKGQGDEAYPYELTTMPGWAGSSWYWFRYMDPKNTTSFADKKEIDYWQDVDLYMGGSEHATGHLLYSRFWCKALKDLGYVSAEEPFKKLINQGHIQGISKFVYRVNGTNKFVSKNLKNEYETTALHADVTLVDNDVLDIEGFKNWRSDYSTAEFILENGKYICGSEVEKMSKSKHNVVNPDDIIDNYGADTLRLYEMFLGPLELSKPWNTNGIDGVFKFLRKFWNLFHDTQGNLNVSDAAPTREELKVLHKTLRKVEQDINNFSFNTTVSEFMICVNELSTLKCNKKGILESLVIALSPYAPHLAEELWEKLGHSDTVLKAQFPNWNEEYLKESSFEYPISINGKVRTKMEFALDMPKEDIEKMVLASELVNKWTEGKPPKKVIVVPGKIVNVVV
ncbi:MAG TPA: class I tRNA ligase family protein [Cyclobacteriaceae bacterium]|nr:class I tRNA ligase family protein [Cyclobacteriaceae bacterium]HRJ82370.1 class I tRNA ligase family protein [Cyclobacteriaceae bacterium]